MNYLVDPSSLLQRALTINNFKQLIANEQIQFSELVDISVEIAEEWTNDWDEEHGFGSSDGTYMLKDFIDTVLNCFANGYKTEFNPYLTVSKIS